jgi:hypothetical protein
MLVYVGSAPISISDIKITTKTDDTKQEYVAYKQKAASKVSYIRMNTRTAWQQ